MTRPRFQAVKGTRDILPPESSLWAQVEQTAGRVFAAYNFQEIRLPVFEETELFARSVGVDTDIVSKEMFSFWDPPLTAEDLNLYAALIRGGHGERQIVPPGRLEEILSRTYISLRPEATASVVRAYIEHGLHTRPGLVKLYYIGPMFRRERPQKGRFRQFYQIGAEVLGPSDHPAIDAEVVELVLVFIERCGLKGTKLFVNSIGCSAPAPSGAEGCRPKYVELLRRELQKVKDKLGPDSQRRIDTNPLRVLDSKVEGEQPIIEKLPSILDHLCAACRDHFKQFQQELKDRGIAYEINWRLVRGLDYYTRTTFEITAPGLGAQNAVCGGGRYDGLSELLGGPPTKGIGWALGTDRLIYVLQEQGVIVPERVDALIAWTDPSAYAHARTLAKLLRDSGLAVEMPSKPMHPREGLGFANKLGIPIGVVIGPDEVSASVYSVRFLSEGEQISIGREDASKLGRLLLFRILLEKSLQQLARMHGIEHKRVAPMPLVMKLLDRGILPSQLKTQIQMALEIFSRAVHGESVSDQEQTEAVARTLFVLHQLSSMHGPRLFSMVQ